MKCGIQLLREAARPPRLLLHWSPRRSQNSAKIYSSLRCCFKFLRWVQSLGCLRSLHRPTHPYSFLVYLQTQFVSAAPPEGCNPAGTARIGPWPPCPLITSPESILWSLVPWFHQTLHGSALPPEPTPTPAPPLHTPNQHPRSVLRGPCFDYRPTLHRENVVLTQNSPSTHNEPVTLRPSTPPLQPADLLCPFWHVKNSFTFSFRKLQTPISEKFLISGPVFRNLRLQLQRNSWFHR